MMNLKGILRTRKDFAKNISEPLERLERKNRLLNTKIWRRHSF